MPFRRLSAYYFCYFAFIGVFMPYFALYLHRRGFPAAEIGLLMSVMQMMRLLAPNLWGWLADHLGRRMPVVRIAAVLSLLGFAGVGQAQSFWALALCIGWMGFFWTAQSPLAEALTFAYVKDQPGLYGRVRAWGSAGFIVMVLVMGWWLEQAGIEWVFYGGVFALLSIVIAAFGVPDLPFQREHKPTPGALWAIFRRREVLALLAGCMLMTAAHGTLNVFYSIHLVSAGYSKGTVGAMWTFGVLAEILVFIYAPQMMARASARVLLMGAFACAVLRFLLVGWCVDWLFVLLFAQLMHGVTFGVSHIAAISTISRWFGEAHQSQGQALYGSIAFGAGGIIGSVVSGALWESFGPAWAFTASAGFALLGLVVYGFGSRPEKLAGENHVQI